jgi:D-alanine-D-alanine ligase
VILHNEVGARALADEQDVLVQAEAVAASLTSLGYAVSQVGVSLDLASIKRRVSELQPGGVFNLIESLDGDERLACAVPILLEGMSVPFTGVGSAAMLVCNDKLLSKRMLRVAGLPTPPWQLCSEAHATGSITIDPPYIVKSAWKHGSLGLDTESVVDSKDGALAKIAALSPADRASFYVERYIDGREFNLSVMGGRREPRVLPAAEIRFDDHGADMPKVVGYRAKWDADSWDFSHTPRSFEFGAGDQPLLDTLIDIARSCWDILGLTGYARVDYRVDTQGRPWILEVNANPCISPDAGFPAAAQRAGMSFTAMVERILRCALSPTTGR